MENSKRKVRNLLLLLILTIYAINSRSAYAQVHSWMKGEDYWVSVDTFLQGDKTAKYILIPNKNGQKIKGKYYKSELKFVEYKCDNTTMRILQEGYTTEPLGQGKVIFQSDTPNSTFKTPLYKTIESSALKLMCSSLMENAKNTTMFSDDKSKNNNENGDLNQNDIQCNKLSLYAKSKSDINYIRDLLTKIEIDKKIDLGRSYIIAAATCECKMRNAKTVLSAINNILEIDQKSLKYNVPMNDKPTNKSMFSYLGENHHSKEWTDKFNMWVLGDGPIPENDDQGRPACSLVSK